MNLKDLKDIPVFSGVPDDILEMFIPLFKEERYSAGHIVFEENEVSDRLFFIKEGEVEIRKATRRKKGGYKPIAVLQSGDFFGEMAVFLDQPRSADAVSKSEAVLVSISREELSKALGESPEAAFKVMGLFTSALTDRLKNTTKELVTIYEAGRLVTAARGVLELSEHVLGSIFESVGPAEEGLFVIWNEFNDEFEIISGRGVEEIEPNEPFPGNDAVVRWLMENMEPLLSFDLENDTRMSSSADSIWRKGSLLACPFLHHERLLGFVVLSNTNTNNAFSYNHMILVSAISGYVSVALENLQFMQAEVDRARLDKSKSTIQPFFR